MNNPTNVRSSMLVLSGDCLNNAFPLFEVDFLLECVERNRRRSGAFLTRQLVTLDLTYSFASYLFLNACFSVVPADDADVQAASKIVETVMSPGAPDEIVFAFGSHEIPVAFLRELGGKTRRVLLILPGQDRRACEYLELICEETIDLSAELETLGRPWDSFELKTGKEWANDFGNLALLRLLKNRANACDAKEIAIEPERVVENDARIEEERVDAEPARVSEKSEEERLDAEPAQASEKSEEERLDAEPERTSEKSEEERLDAEPERTSEKSEEERLDAEPARTSEKSEEERLDAEPARVSEKSEEERLDAEPARVSEKSEEERLDAEPAQASEKSEEERLDAEPARVSEKSEEERVCERFLALKDEWSVALEEVLLAEPNRIKTLAEATKALEDRFPGLQNFALFHSGLENDAFRRALDGSNIRFTTGTDGLKWLYHASEPSTSMVNAKSFYERLETSFALDQESGSCVVSAAPVIYQAAKESVDFVVSQSKSRVEYCEMKATIVEGTAPDPETALKEWDDRLLLEGLNAFDSAPDCSLSASDYRFLARSYERLANCLTLLRDAFDNAFCFFDRQFAFDSIQLGASAHCLIKSTLDRHKCDWKGEKTWKIARYYLMTVFNKFSETFSHFSHIKNLAADSFVDADIASELDEAYVRIREDFEKKDALNRALLYNFAVLKSNAQGLKEDPDSAEYYWANIEKAIRVLCEKYAARPTLPELTETIAEIVDLLPAERVNSETFAKTVERARQIANEKTDLIDSEVAENATREIDSSSEIEAVRRFLGNGKKVAILDAESAPSNIIEEMKETFSCEVVWNRRPYGQAHKTFIEESNDPAVALFIIIVARESHCNTLDLRYFVESCGKKFVRLTDASNPVFVAREICEQLDFDVASRA